MPIKILMPALSPTMTQGTLNKWHVKIGDTVKAGDLIAEIETDKATMEVEAVDEGKITNILVEEGNTNVKVNSTIAVLNGSSEDVQNNPEEDIIESNKVQSDKDYDSKNIKEEIKKIDLPLNNSQNVKTSPLVKKIAKEKNINLNNLKGSGPDGRIIKRDLENYNTNENLSFDNLEQIEPSSMRKIIAERTTTTKNTVPHYYLTIESQVDKLINLRKQINDKSNIKISINDILIKSLALAQKNNPKTNVSWINDKIIRYNSVDVSVAVALPEGLITPIIKNADRKGLFEIAKEIKFLSKKAKEGKLIPEEYTGGTISISNLGMFGIDQFSAIINPPQSSILAVGSINKVPKYFGEEIKPISILKSTLSVDHRVIDGAVAANFLKDFNDIIENPFNLWLESNDLEIL